MFQIRVVFHNFFFISIDYGNLQALERKLRMHIQNPVRYPRWSFLRKQSTTSRTVKHTQQLLTNCLSVFDHFVKPLTIFAKTQSQMFNRILNTLLNLHNHSKNKERRNRKTPRCDLLCSLTHSSNLDLQVNMYKRLVLVS